MRIETAEITVDGRKKIVNADDPRVRTHAVQEETQTEKVSLPTRSDIAKMGKAEVVEWLRAHGVEAPEGKVADLRKALAKIMWADL